MLNNSIETAITHRFILGTHIRQKLYQKIINGRFILGSQSLNKLTSIKQTTRLYTNYLNNTITYTVSYVNIIHSDQQRSRKHLYLEKKHKKVLNESRKMRSAIHLN